jgi:ATP-dependent Clp protease ATP-binding subunit ClpA
MFERYTEGARRTIFFARYEASVFGSPHIETEHLLLAVLREHRLLKVSQIEEIRKEIQQRSPKRERIATSVDLPLSGESKSVLRYAAQAADELQHKHIDTGHLMLGLLREEKSLAAEILRKQGVDYEAMRSLVAAGLQSRTPHAADPEPQMERPVAAPSIDLHVARLRDMALAAEHHLDYFSERDARTPKGIERKAALGRLIDEAAAHHLWLARCVVEPPPTGAEKRYSGARWRELVKAWLSLNDVLIHEMSAIPEEELDREAPDRVAAYVDLCEEELGRIFTRG